MKRILVTGAAGLIGHNLCKKLLNDGYDVIGLDNFITGEKKNIAPLLKNSRFKFIKHDINKNLELRIKNLEWIFHLACPTGVPNIKKLGEEMALTCSVGTKNVLDLARRHRAKLLFTSSSEVYGDPQIFPQSEDYTGNVDPTDYRSPYEEGKRFSETLISLYVRKYHLDARIVRVFNTYGPGMSDRDSRVISTFLYQARQGKSLTVQGDGRQKRTFCHVDDLINGLILIMEKGKKGQVYNLGSDKETTILELAKMISSNSIKFIPRPGHDHKRRLPDLSKVRKLGWKLQINLQEGLSQL
jgi:nucleoside-diphosphate-sugar epimerase